jgi:neurofibromin 1
LIVRPADGVKVQHSLVAALRKPARSALVNMASPYDRQQHAMTGGKASGSLHSHSYSASHGTLHKLSLKSSQGTDGNHDVRAMYGVGTSRETAVGQIGSQQGSMHRQSITSLTDGTQSLVTHSSATADTLTAGEGSRASNDSAGQALIASVVQKLAKRLPHITGRPLARIERDELIRSTVANVIKHGQTQLATVMRELLQVLDSLNKMSQSLPDDSISSSVMESQQFILQILVATLIHTWKTSQTSSGWQKHDAGTTTNGQQDDIAHVARGWIDPPPLEDVLAKQALGVMTFYIRHMFSREDEALLKTGNEAVRKGKDEDVGESSSDSVSVASLALSHGISSFLLQYRIPTERPPFQLEHLYDPRKIPAFVPEASESILSSTNNLTTESSGSAAATSRSIYRLAAQVIFYLSSSNWAVIFARIRNRLTYLSTTTEDAPNTAEIRLLECSNLPRARLGTVVQELCSSFVHLKRPAQQLAALTIRRSIWTWIQYHPAEFATLHTEGRRLDGGPDILFDLAFPMAESTRKKYIFWPMLTSLLLLCPDMIDRLLVSDTRKAGGGNGPLSTGRKGLFVEALRKGVRNSKTGDVALLCCIDVCRAAYSTSPNDTALRHFAGDLEADVRERLFDPRKLSTGPLSSSDVPLMCDALIAAFNLNPQKTMQSLLPLLTNDNTTALKTVLVKALIGLAGESGRLPWQPSLSLVYSSVAGLLRSTFKNLVSRVSRSALTTESGATRRFGTGKSLATEEHINQQELIASILQLWLLDPQIIFYNVDTSLPTTMTSLARGGDVFDDDGLLRNALNVDSQFALMYVISRVPIISELKHLHLRTDAVIQASVERVLGDTDKTLQTFECALMLTTSYSASLAQQLASAKSTQMQAHWLTCLSASLSRKLTLYSAEALSVDSTSQHLSSKKELEWESGHLEKAILLAICSVDTAVCSSTQRLCSQLVLYRRAASFLHVYNEPWTTFYGILGSQEVFQTGRMAQQKRIRACLRDAPFCTKPVIDAWREAYARWSALTLVVARPLADDSPESAQDQAAQWDNYAGFLSALGGACAVDSWHQAMADSATLYNGGAPSAVSDSPLRDVEAFIQEMVDLLVSDSIWVREKAKEILGQDLSPRLNGILLRMIHSVLSDFFDKATGQPRPSSVYTIFVEHSIGVIQNVLSRTHKANEATANVDIGALMVLYIEYLNAITNREQAVRIRHLMCTLCETFLIKRSFFTFSNEVRVRNRLFQVLCGWSTDSIDEQPTSDRTEKIQRDLDASCLRTMALLLERLPLLLPEDTPIVDETIESAKARHFSSQFNYFIKVLSRGQSSSDTGKAATQRDAIQRSAITALSSMLAANIESGLHQSLPLAYHDDLRLRTAFMQIMTNVLNQGTAFDQLDPLTATQKPNRLIDLICEPDMQLALSLCSVCKGYDDGGMDYILLNIFDSRGGIIRFLKAAMFEEIEKTLSEEMVFRSNSFRTHLLSAFGRTHGYEYLRTIIAPLITDMINKPRGYSFEIDSQKMDSSESLIVNQHRLEEMAQTFIDQICSSAHRVPAVLRELCRHIRQLMDRRFPSSRYQGVGGFIFLRFINPAIVAPQNIDVDMGASNKDVRRGLLLVSKILQTLASNTLFPQHKEPFMTRLNDFLKRNVWKVTNFLDQVSDTRTDPDRLAAADQPLGFGIHPFGYGLDSEDQSLLHKFIYDNVDKIGRELLTRHSVISPGDDAGLPSSDMSTSAASKGYSDDGTSPLSPNAKVDGKRVYEQLCITLAELGECKTEENPIGLSSENSKRPAHAEFLRKHQGKSVDEEKYKAILREGPHSKANRPVYYLTLFRLSSQTFDFEAFTFYALQTMQTCASQPFDLLVDCTNMMPDNMIPHQWANYLVTLMPTEIIANLRTVITFNTNTTCRLWLRPWQSQAERISSPPRESAMAILQSNINIVTCNTLAELEGHIDRRKIALDPYTTNISTVKEETRFDNITMVWYYRVLVPVTFKISEEHLQISCAKPTPLIGSSSACLNEVFHLADVEDVRSITVRGDDNTFFVTCRGGAASFLFISRNRNEVVQALRQAKARVSRFTHTSTARTGIEYRSMRPNDVPGTLLNMALLNITSRDSLLRLSAYGLMCALSTSFNFGASKASKRLLSAKGLSISANSLAFVTELSKEFALASPGVTLEFLTSFFEGFERADINQKFMGLHYISPWLSNLVMFTHTSRDQQREYLKRIKEILSHLIAITVKEPGLYAVMQRTVWAQFTKLDDLLTILIDIFAECAIDFGLHTDRFEVVLDSMLSFSSINLRGKLLVRLRAAISKTAQTPSTVKLEDNAAWKEIVTLTRMCLALSFSGRLETQLYLPELIHVILLLAGRGDQATRQIVHTLAVNVIHSLCTEDVASQRNEARLAIGSGAASAKRDGAVEAECEPVDEKDGITPRLEAFLHRLSEDECLRMFGLPAAGSAVDGKADATEAVGGKDGVAQLASLFYGLVEIAAPTVDCANSWRARIVSLVTSKAFQYNPTIQSRAFVLLGQLAELTRDMEKSSSTTASMDGEIEMPSFEVDDDLLYQILVSLRGSLQEWATFANDSTVVSLVQCLGRVARILPDHSRYLGQLFWLGVSVLHFGHLPLFRAGVELIHATVKTIVQRKLPEAHDSDLINYLLDVRYEFREAACRLDDETGVDFEFNFSFGLAALLAKGLRHPSTREDTVDLLQTMLSVIPARREDDDACVVSTEQLGFFLSLLPTAGRPEDFGHLLHLAGLPAARIAEAVHVKMQSSARRATPDLTTNGASSEQLANGSEIFSYIVELDNKVALLFITLVFTLLRQSGTTDAERQVLYAVLADCTRRFPAIVSILYEYLVPHMRDVYLSSQNEDITRSVDTMAQIAISEPIFQLQVQETKRRGGAEAYLDESGYVYLLECGDFVPLRDTRRMVLAKLATSVLSGLTDAATI